MSVVDPTEIGRIRDQIDLAAQTAQLGIGSWLHERQHLFGLGEADAPAVATRDAVLIHAALTYLAVNGLIGFAGRERYGQWLTAGFDEVWAAVMSEKLVAVVAAAAAVQADAVRPWPPDIELDPRLVRPGRGEDGNVCDGCDTQPGV